MEGTIAVPGGNVWFKRIGGGAGLPLLAVHGGPGLPHDYMTALARLANEREVIFWDQLGCGRSERPSIAQPTLLIAGTFDQCSPEHMTEMHRRIDGSRFSLFESSSHMPFIEEPERFDQVMREFLRQHDN